MPFFDPWGRRTAPWNRPRAAPCPGPVAPPRLRAVGLPGPLFWHILAIPTAIATPPPALRAPQALGAITAAGEIL